MTTTTIDKTNVISVDDLIPEASEGNWFFLAGSRVAQLLYSHYGSEIADTTVDFITIQSMLHAQDQIDWDIEIEPEDAYNFMFDDAEPLFQVARYLIKWFPTYKELKDSPNFMRYFPFGPIEGPEIEIKLKEWENKLGN